MDRYEGASLRRLFRFRRDFQQRPGLWISSLAVAVLLSLTVVFMLDRLLNCFASTRWASPL